MRAPLHLLPAVVTLLLAGQADAQRQQDRWQQHVRYQMDVSLTPETHHIAGRQRLVYTNNSPDTLRHLFYHLYPNAFQPGSGMDLQYKRLTGTSPIARLRPDQQGSLRPLSLTADGRPVALPADPTDDTILKVELPEPLLPGAEVTLEMLFNGQVPLQTRRSGRDNREGVDYSMSQWYPKLAEYDRDGWHPDPYIGREFYGVWGDFSVNLTLPSAYTVGATGDLLNPDEVGHGYGAATAATGDSTTWRFQATTVHDFAWVADTQYRHDTTSVDGVTIHLLYTPNAAPLWTEMPAWCRSIIQTYNRTYGKYPYNQFTVAMGGDGGMEYPQLVMLRGLRSRYDLASVTAHEMGHNWFYGLLGSNESRYGWMDEGMTSWAESVALTDLFGSDVDFDTDALDRFFVLPMSDLENTLRGYQAVARSGYEEYPLNWHSDRFPDNSVGNTAYYSKGGTTLAMLKAIVGDSLFNQTMHVYIDRWHFKHPQPDDFQRVAEDVSGMELDWFFDTWLRSTDQYDYALDHVLRGEAIQSDDGQKRWPVEITVSNRDRGILPLDLTLTLKGGQTQRVHVPLDLAHGHRPLSPGEILAPTMKWNSERHTIRLLLDAPLRKAELLPDPLVQDMNRLNNGYGVTKLRTYLYTQPQLAPPLDAYWLTARPSVWYGELTGLRLGARAEGGYARNERRLSLGAWYATDPGRLEYDLGFAHPADFVGRDGLVQLRASWLYGVRTERIGLTKSFGSYLARPEPTVTVSVWADHQMLEGAGKGERIDLVTGRLPWSPGQFYGLHTRLGFVSKTGRTRLTVEGETSLFNSWSGTPNPYGGYYYDDPVQPFPTYRRPEAPQQNRPFGKGWVELVHQLPFGRGFGLTMRGILGVGGDDLPAQKRFSLVGASGEEAWASTAYRSLAGLDRNLAVGLGEHTGLVAAGGGDVIGYADRLDIVGQALLAGNLRLGVPNVLARPTRQIPVVGRLMRDLSFAVTADGGVVSNQFSSSVSGDLDPLRQDPSGRDPQLDYIDYGFVGELGLAVGYAPTFPEWRYGRYVSDILGDLRMELRLPLWLSDPRPGESNWAGRAFFTVNRAF